MFEFTSHRYWLSPGLLLVALLQGCDNNASAKTGHVQSTNSHITIAIQGAPVKSLVTLNDMACILVDGGQVYCWGPEASGELNVSALHKVDLGEGKTAKAIYGSGSEAGGPEEAGFHACAVLNDGSVRCWAQTITAMLENIQDARILFDLPATNTDTSATSKKKPVTTFPLKKPISQKLDNPKRLFMNADVICGLLQDDTLYCPHPQLAFLNGKTQVRDVYVGDALACITMKSDEVECYNQNTSGSTHAPILISFDGELNVNMFAARFRHPQGICIIDKKSIVSCLENGVIDYNIQYTNIHMFEVKPIKFPVKNKPVSVALVDTHACVLFENGQVNCWGMDTANQLTSRDTDKPIPPPGVTMNLGTQAHVKQMSLSPNSSCFLLDNQEVKCVGRLYEYKERSE